MATPRRPSARAHPRACGENPMGSLKKSATPGSSPRVRGKPDGQDRRFTHCGLIPARAGKTRVLLRCSDDSPAHPRACGENANNERPRVMTTGSSPRVRGKQSAVEAIPRPPRLIPARAGKTRVLLRCSDDSPAHPRACGENANNERPRVMTTGSSPRVRGKQSAVEAIPRPPRLIPARAGKTTCRCTGSWRRTAHPRACGENKGTVLPAPSQHGSSPRVRGKPGASTTTARSCGLIPARAGKQDLAAPRGPLGRLIPARAGKTGSASPGSSRRSAHPRACGENVPK